MQTKYHDPKKRATLFIACLLLILTGCSSASHTVQNGQGNQDVSTEIGAIMRVEAPRKFILLDNKDVLSADGLYYATWGVGNSSPYENSDGDMIDLYDAQLYLLASETKDEKTAEKSCQAWLASAKDHYEIHNTDAITCNGQSYTLIDYDCIGEDTPYDHGVSALGVCGANAICVELTCTKDYEEDLALLLNDFLNCCHYYRQN